MDTKLWLKGNLEQEPDGTLVAYIAFWRYLFFGLLFAAAFYISVQILIKLFQELPPEFWTGWDKIHTAILIFLVIAIGTPFFAFNFLKSGYKKVQLEISKNNIRYLRKAIRGGILLSDDYITVPIKYITDIQLQGNLFGGGVIIAKTPTQVHLIILLLNEEDQQICYRALENALKISKSSIS